MTVASTNGDGVDDRFFELVAARRPSLPPSERRVADFVLGQPERIVLMSIGALAEAVGVSQPTVLRFARALGLTGYPELKLRTGQSIVTGTPYVHSEVAADDPLTSVVDKVVDSSIYALTAMRRSLDQSVLDRVIGILATAPRIDCYGTGAARVLATEAQHKLMRFGIPVAAYDDTHLQRLAAASLRQGDVALCFSYTGRVRDTVAMARAARQCGATVVSITRPGTALAAAADVVLEIDAHEDTEIYAPMVSRVAHVVLLDIIVTSIALRGGAALQDRLRAAKNSLADLRIPSAGDGAAAKRRRVNANGRGGRRPAAGEEQDTP